MANGLIGFIVFVCIVTKACTSYSDKNRRNNDWWNNKK